jgi:hypothetical protein
VLFRKDPKDSTASPDESDAVAAGKGRPTPSRKEAEAARKDRVRPVLDKRQAARSGRSATREQRMKQRQALLDGDERALPARDRGPVRRYARDYVDAHRTVGELMLPSMVVFLPLSLAIGSLKGTAVGVFVTVAVYVYMVVMIGGTALVARKVKAAAQARYPGEEVRGVGVYAALRSVQLRRWRLPKPKVKVGDAI